MRIKLSYFLPAALGAMAKPTSARLVPSSGGKKNKKQHLRKLSDTSSSFPEMEFSASMSMALMSRSGSGSSSKAAKTPGLVNSPGFDEYYLQNDDYGMVNDSRFNLDYSLEVLSHGTTDAYVYGRERLMEIITGDLMPVNASDIPEEIRMGIGSLEGFCSNPLPEVIDDSLICIKEQVLQDQFLAIFDPLGGRFEINGDGDEAKEVGIETVLGQISFNINLIPGLASRTEGRSWYTAVLYILLRTLGFGIEEFLEYLGLVDESSDSPTYVGQHALDVWQNDWGCDGDLPFAQVEGGTFFGAWDPSCMVGELMANDGLKISKLSIAALKDLGYPVDYAAADDFDGSDTTCCKADPDSLQAASMPIKPPLSEEMMATAQAYGKELLSKRQTSASIASTSEEAGDQESIADSSYINLAGQFVHIFIEENDELYEVKVTAETDDV